MTTETTPRKRGAEPTTIEYDVVVIGAGPVGENVADRVTRGGLRAAVVEEDLVGGECSYWACMPTKALLRSTAALRAAQRLPGAREAVIGELDAAAVLRRRDDFASHWHDDGQASWLEHAGIALHRGQGRLRGPRTVDVLDRDRNTTTLVARHAVVVATGTSALLPDLPGFLHASPWTSRDAAAAAHVPARLAVIGGGVVAMEMATAFTGLGSRVTVLARDGVLPAAEPFAATTSPTPCSRPAHRSVPAPRSAGSTATRTATPSTSPSPTATRSTPTNCSSRSDAGPTPPGWDWRASG